MKIIWNPILEAELQASLSLQTKQEFSALSLQNFSLVFAHFLLTISSSPSVKMTKLWFETIKAIVIAYLQVLQVSVITNFILPFLICLIHSQAPSARRSTERLNRLLSEAILVTEVEFVVEDVVKFVVDSVAEGVVKGVVDSVVDSVVEVVVEDVVEAVVEGVVDSVVENVVDSVVEAVVEGVVDSVVENVVYSVVGAVVEGVVDSVVEVVVKDVVDSVVEAVVKGVVDSVVDSVVEVVVEGVIGAEVEVDNVLVKGFGVVLFSSPHVTKRVVERSDQHSPSLLDSH
ncbi:hypothetical protein KQX54_010339 [Cotesia glomerata]|uniref:Uncharacterized protein n=1 Tax=Cotesia glomerata TaxID=32391 RepID=A0AAV7IG05_COTGL|nr:hypothetical protein KQX54_010339 [Cotesia glomerata]